MELEESYSTTGHNENNNMHAPNLVLTINQLL